MLRFILAIPFACLLSACGEPSTKEPEERPTVAKICRDGTYIFHYKDGTYRTGGFGSIVEDINKVCESN